MRKIIVFEHISLDGVIQSPGAPDEDTSDGFAYGGWQAPYGDHILEAALQKQINMPFDLMLGRKTFDIWAAFWQLSGARRTPEDDRFVQRVGRWLERGQRGYRAVTAPVRMAGRLGDRARRIFGRA